MSDTIPAEGPGSILGHYRLLESLGEGGFGTVFRAEQEEPVRRQVALKLIKLGLDTKEVVARFEAERLAHDCLPEGVLQRGELEALLQPIGDIE